MTYDPRQLCGDCDGEGFYPQDDSGRPEPCPRCDGKGYVMVPETPYDAARDPFAGQPSFVLDPSPLVPEDDSRCSYGVEGCDSGTKHPENLCDDHHADSMSAGVDWAESIMGDR